MKRRILLIAIAALIIMGYLPSCKRVVDINLDGDPSVNNPVVYGSVFRTSVISATAQVLSFYTDVYVVDAQISSLTGLQNTNFSIADTTVSGFNLGFTQDSLKAGQHIDVKKNLSTAILLDQGGSMASVDPQDNRIQAVKNLISDGVGKDNFALLSFDKTYPDIGVLQWSSIHWGFNVDKSKLYKTIDSLATKENGITTPLVIALFNTFDYINRVETNESTAIIVLSSRADTEGGRTYPEVAQLASKKNTTSFIIGLGNNYGKFSDNNTLANQSKGGFIAVPNIRDLPKQMELIRKLSKGNVSYYRILWRMQVKNGNVNPQIVGKFDLKIQKNNTIIKVPFSINLGM